jgi:hypothetical protein
VNSDAIAESRRHIRASSGRIFALIFRAAASSINEIVLLF